MEVTNKLWALYFPSAIILTVLNVLLFKPDYAALITINIAATFILSIALWLAHAIGGADTKAMICIGTAHTTSLLAFGYTGVMMLTAYIVTHGKRKSNNIPLIPFLTLALGLATVQILI